MGATPRDFSWLSQRHQSTPQKLFPRMKAIPLGRWKCVIVDNADYGIASVNHWHPHKGRSTFYASRLKYTDGKPKRVYLHRELLGITDPKIQVDHEDGNGLNCQRENLRIASNSQNHQGKMTRPAHFTSRFRGVYWHKQNQNWCAEIKLLRQKKHIGSFTNEVDAARAYDEAAGHFFGEFAQRNFSKI